MTLTKGQVSLITETRDHSFVLRIELIKIGDVDAFMLVFVILLGGPQPDLIFDGSIHLPTSSNISAAFFRLSKAWNTATGFPLPHARSTIPRSRRHFFASASNSDSSSSGDWAPS